MMAGESTAPYKSIFKNHPVHDYEMNQDCCKGPPAHRVIPPGIIPDIHFSVVDGKINGEIHDGEYTGSSMKGTSRTTRNC